MFYTRDGLPVFRAQKVCDFSLSSYFEKEPFIIEVETSIPRFDYLKKAIYLTFSRKNQTYYFRNVKFRQICEFWLYLQSACLHYSARLADSVHDDIASLSIYLPLEYMIVRSLRFSSSYIQLSRHAEREGVKDRKCTTKTAPNSDATI